MSDIFIKFMALPIMMLECLKKDTLFELPLAIPILTVALFNFSM